MNRGQSLANGAIGIALLHLETGNWPAAREQLCHATAGPVSIGTGASLFYGAPALAYVLATTDHPGLAQARAVTADGTATVTRRQLEAGHRRIDRRERPDYAEYDLIRGLTGLGVVARRLGDHDLLRQVLDYLVRLTEPIGERPGWWCANGPDRTQSAEGGHANHGMAHGVTGPLALLALTARDGITVHGQTAAISRICDWLDAWQQTTDDGATWWPQTISRTDLAHGTASQGHPLRPSWCYGTPGIARAQQLAAQALHDPARQQLAETAFAVVAADLAQTRHLADRGLCHGTAGLLATARRIAADARVPIPLAPIEHLHRQATPVDDEPDGLLDGAAGASLATAATVTTAWDACLLLT